MKYEINELMWLYKELLKTGSKFTVITYDPQFGDLQRGFEFEPVNEPYHWVRVTNYFKQDSKSESKQISIVPAKVLLDYLRLAITSASCVEVYEKGEELTYIYGKQEKH